MESRGIYTLANDIVFDQLVAFLNSVEENVGSNLPVCLIPYDDRLEKVKAEIGGRPKVTLYENYEEIRRWEEFAEEVWAAHPVGKQKKFASLVKSKVRLQRKMVVFDGDFEKFVFYDVDTLAMKPLEDIWEKLETYDFVFDDWEFSKQRLTALNLKRIEETGEFTEAQVRPKLHCSSFFGSKRGFFAPDELAEIQARLIENREVEWISGIADAFLFSYLTFRGNRPMFNYTLSPNVNDRTGNCADADQFVNINNVLYNEQGLKPIHRIHYMNYSSADFARLCRGEDVKICYKDVFLHYRFLKQPDLKPKTVKPSSSREKASRFLTQAIKKVKKTLS